MRRIEIQGMMTWIYYYKYAKSTEKAKVFYQCFCMIERESLMSKIFFQLSDRFAFDTHFN